eukprot:TRINITY_DN12764_c0_g1_i1.p1 TRINITY_DN12764_c0_g1~~TRINITY_DN12764_c0_g1_i1.p1  ORF type:complete len:552 (+),score=99.95 TRINITY_DN12764_c0_g1_i1:56-1711(+)
MASLPSPENQQEQLDEITVIQSIFPDNFTPVDLDNHPHIYQVAIQPTLSHPVKLQAEYTNNTSTGTTKSEIVKLSYLSPMHLEVILTPNYPSSSPPKFIIKCSWLTNSHLAELCHQLDNLWKDQFGMVVVFTWVNFLQTEALPHLGLTDALPLMPGGGPPTSESRGISETSSDLEYTIRELVTFNAKQEEIIFFQTIQECPVCFSDKIGREMLRLSCRHYLCKDCAGQHCLVKIKEGNVVSLNCTERGCKTPYRPEEIKQVVSPDYFARWEEKMIESNPNALYCPRCERLAKKDDEKLARCGSCFYSFCPICQSSYHPVTPCFEGITQEDLTDFMKAGDDKGNRRQQLMQQMQQKASLILIQKCAMACPGCGVPIQKDGGCNKMTCQNCNAFFCFCCRQIVSGYEHFSQEGSTCTLWSDEILNQWARQMQAVVEVRERPRLEGENPKEVVFRLCPHCRVQCVKIDNNNHILCWSCGHHFCFLCGKHVKNSASHFSKSGCPQHSTESPVKNENGKQKQQHRTSRPNAAPQARQEEMFGFNAGDYLDDDDFDD